MIKISRSQEVEVFPLEDEVYLQLTERIAEEPYRDEFLLPGNVIARLEQDIDGNYDWKFYVKKTN